MGSPHSATLPPALPGTAVQPPARPARRGAWREALRASTALIAFSLLVLAASWGAIGFEIRRERAEAIANAEVSLSNLARAFAEHSVKTIEGADQAIRFTRNEALERGRDQLDIAGWLRDRQIIGSAYQLLSVIGADGFVSHSSQPFQRVDLRDRAHFRFHAEGTGDRLYISRPVLGRVSGKWSIQLTRRIDARDGSFGGVVVLSLAPSYLTRFYQDVDLGRQGVIALVGHDGVVRARATPGDSETAQDVGASAMFRAAMERKVGVVRAVSSIDRVERLYAFRGLDEYGLVVSVGKGMDDILAEPRQRAEGYVVAGGVLTAVIVLFVFGLVRKARVQLELLRRLEHSRAQANAANRMKTKFLASVSHELRTPLNGIIGYAELIRDTASDEESREFGRIIHHSAGHLHGLVNAILDLAKIESGRMEVHAAPVDVAALLADAAAARAAQAEARGLHLRIEAPAPGSLEVRTDRAHLLQVLDRLLDNAIKFCDRGEIVLRASAGPAGRLRIEVSDTGPSIRAELLPHLFTRFHAVDAEFVHPGQGAGLGLPLCHELMQLLGGSVALRSTAGEGTTVTLELPQAASTHPVNP
jgi:two-component system sensor histidine kinase BarA